MDISEIRLMRPPAVLALVGVSRSSLYAMVARGVFPPPVRIGLRSVGWRARCRWLACQSACGQGSDARRVTAPTAGEHRHLSPDVARRPGPLHR